MSRFLKIALAAILLFPFALSAQDRDEPNAEREAEEVAFNNAVYLMKLERYDKALPLFNEYLEIYYDGVYREEAFRNVAQIYFGKYDYRKALRYYRELFEEFTTTDEGVDAYYNMGICYSKMGNEDRANSIYRDIIDNYSWSSVATKAKTQLDLTGILQR